MSQTEQGTAGTDVDDATVAANADILAALDSVGGADDPPADAQPSDVRVAAASGARIGHGAIRLRSQPPPRLDDTTPGVTAPEVAATRQPVGHGAIRLLTPDSVPVEPAAATPEVAAVEAPVGHGSIRFVDRALRLDDAATQAAESEILAVLSSRA